MKFKQLLKAFAFFRNVLRGMAREQRQYAHRFEDAQHFIVRTQCPRMREHAIIRSLQFIGHKPGEGIEHRRLSRRRNFGVGCPGGRTHGRNTCLARSNSEKSRRR
jgi:hypothetical protein